MFVLALIRGFAMDCHYSAFSRYLNLELVLSVMEWELLAWVKGPGLLL